MPIRRATLHPDTLVKVGCGKTGAAIGTVRVGGRDIPALIKWLTQPKLAAEVFCACLAANLGFTVPEPLLVKTPRGIAFGSAFVSYPNLVDFFPVQIGGTSWVPVVARVLSRWSKNGLLLAFDELIDNRDRNLGNLLVLADQGDYAPIDHEEALGLSRMAPVNKLALVFLNCGDDALIEAVEQAAIGATWSFGQDIGQSECDDLGIHPEIAPWLHEFVELLSKRRPGVAHRLAEIFQRPWKLPL